MTKLAIIVGGVVLMAGVALAGTLTSLGSSGTPAGQTIAPVLSTTTSAVQSEDRNRAGDDQSTVAVEREHENRARENEDLRGPCDEAEHANDARCTGAAVQSAEDRHGADDRQADDHSGRGGGEDHSGHGGDDD